MPDGGRGFYTDNEDGPAYAKFFGEELPSIIERNFHAKQTRAGRAIGPKLSATSCSVLPSVIGRALL
jgi:S-formylglutathione hydrolase FrmB